MEELFSAYKSELLASMICLAVFLILRLTITKTIRKIAKISDLNMVRTRMVTKYITFALSFIVLGTLVLIWGVDFKEIGLILSSAFAVLGVALFATWSILSNVTAGVILFLSFPYKIGDRIRILDKDFPEEAIILDIKAFTVNLIKDNGEMLTYPNNLLLQKGVILIQKDVATSDDLEHTF